MQRSSRRFSVLPIDDSPEYRATLAAVVGQDERLDLAGEAHDRASGVEAVSALAPDVAVIDLGLATAESWDLLEAVGRESPLTRVLLVAEQADTDVVRSLVAAGVAGYLQKDAPEVALSSAIVTVAAGEAALSATMLSSLASTAPTLGEGPESPLTPREREIGALAAMGYSNAEIGERLYVSPETVKTHLTHIYRKLKVTGRTAAAAELMRQRIDGYPPDG
jgi:DNA-binding NarL/FixJ family response regulator